MQEVLNTREEAIAVATDALSYVLEHDAEYLAADQAAEYERALTVLNAPDLFPPT